MNDPKHDRGGAARAAAPSRTANPRPGSRPLPSPAWEGCPVAPANLVLEGGAMRGLFTAGVLDFFQDRKLFCERVIGVSAGALCGYNYVAGDSERTAVVNLSFCDDWRYLSLRSFAVTGNAYGREFCFDEVPNRLIPADYDAFDRSPMRLVAVSSDLDAGRADYHEFSDAVGDLPYLIASSSMPVVSRIVEVDGKRLLDGGTCDSVPIVYSLLTGARKHIVVLTRQQGYAKEPNRLMALMERLYADCPRYLERAKHRHVDYNHTYDLLERLHEEGRVFVIRPQRPVEVKQMETDQAKLMDLYEQGAAEAARQWPALQAYLEA